MSRNGVRAEQQSRVNGDRRNAAADLGEQHAELEEAAATAADGLGQRDAQQVGGSQLAPQRFVVTNLARFQVGEVFGRCAVLEELAGNLADGLLFFGE